MLLSLTFKHYPIIAPSIQLYSASLQDMKQAQRSKEKKRVHEHERIPSQAMWSSCSLQKVTSWWSIYAAHRDQIREHFERQKKWMATMKCLKKLTNKSWLLCIHLCGGDSKTLCACNWSYCRESIHKDNCSDKPSWMPPPFSWHPFRFHCYNDQCKVLVHDCDV